MWIDLARDYPAGSHGLGCLATNELNTVVAVLPFLLTSVNVLHGALFEFHLGGHIVVLVKDAIAIPVNA
jgi:hypothetical protein